MGFVTLTLPNEQRVLDTRVTEDFAHPAEKIMGDYLEPGQFTSVRGPGYVVFTQYGQCIL